MPLPAALRAETPTQAQGGSADRPPGGMGRTTESTPVSRICQHQRLMRHPPPRVPCIKGGGGSWGCGASRGVGAAGHDTVRHRLRRGPKRTCGQGGRATGALGRARCRLESERGVENREGMHGHGGAGAGDTKAAMQRSPPRAAEYAATREERSGCRTRGWMAAAVRRATVRPAAGWRPSWGRGWCGGSRTDGQQPSLLSPRSPPCIRHLLNGLPPSRSALHKGMHTRQDRISRENTGCNLGPRCRTLSRLEPPKLKDEWLRERWAACRRDGWREEKMEVSFVAGGIWEWKGGASRYSSE